MSTSSPAKPAWETEGEEKSAAVRGLFGNIAGNYDLGNALMTWGQHKAWRRKAARLLNLKDGDVVLDVCCGTGDFLADLRALVGPSGWLVGADFSRPMLEISKQKDGAASLVVADATRLPLSGEQFNGVTCGWGIRNVKDADQAHREIVRLLKPGGRFVSIDCAEPNVPILGPISKWLANAFIPIVGRLLGHVHEYTYLPRSVARHRTRQELADSMKAAGLVDVGWKNLALGNICIHCGTKPEASK